MTITEAKENGFTHKGMMYNFIKVYCKDVDTFEPTITGVSFIHDKLLLIVTYLDSFFLASDAFEIKNLQQI